MLLKSRCNDRAPRSGQTGCCNPRVKEHLLGLVAVESKRPSITRKAIRSRTLEQPLIGTTDELGVLQYRPLYSLPRDEYLELVGPFPIGLKDVGLGVLIAGIVEIAHQGFSHKSIEAIIDASTGWVMVIAGLIVSLIASFLPTRRNKLKTRISEFYEKHNPAVTDSVEGHLDD